MGELVELDVTTVEESVTVNVTEEGQVQISVVAETGPAGPAGPNSVTSATTSDGTCDLSLDTLTVGLSTVSGVRSVAIGQSTASGALSFASGASTASDDYCFANGDNSTASGYASTASGTGCTASGYASDASGDGTVSSGYASIASGSVSEATGDYSIALGRRAKAIHDGASVEADSQNADVESTTTDEKTFRFANGYRFLGGAVTIDDTLNCDHIHGNLAGSVYAHIRAGENLAKGDPVYVSGSHGSGATLIPVVSKADASNAAKMPAVGVMDAAVANNANGHMVITGTITELDTNAYPVNTVLYVATGGGWTSTPPAANSQAVAIVERSNTNNGAVIVKVNGLGSSGGNGAADANKLVRYNSTGGASLNGGTLTDMTYAGTAAFTSTTRPTSAGTGTPAATSLITLADAASSTIISVRDEFIGGGITTTNIGELAWYQFSSGGGTGALIDAPTASLPQMGIRGIRSSNAINSANTIYFPAIGNLLSVTGWEMTFVIQLNQTTACDMIVGVTKDNGAIGIGKFGGISFGCRYSSAHDTNFMFYAKNSNSDFAANDANNFSVSSGVAVNTNYNTFRIRSTSIGSVEMSINGGAFVAVTTSMISTASPFIIFVYISTRETASKTATIDFFSLRSTTTRL